MDASATYLAQQVQFSQSLGVRLRQLRLEHGYTQEQVANATGMALYTVQKLEKGATPKGTPLNPRSFTLLKLADLYDMSISELLDL